MKIGDLIRWKLSGELALYLGFKKDVYRFYSPNYGRVERWSSTFNPSSVEVVSEGR